MAKKSPTNGAGEAPAETTPELVTVRVLGQPVCEDGQHFAKDQTFETTADRASCLAGLVEIITE